MKKKRTTKLAAALVAALIALAALPLAAGAEELPRGTGYVPADKETYEVPGAQSQLRRLTNAVAETLPSSYRSDEEPWAVNVRVKDQLDASICWAMAMTTASEYSYAKEMYETTGEVYEVEETSPAHIAQFFYNRVNDPLDNTAGDYNDLPDGHWLLDGGNEVFGMQHLATWSGLALEEDAPLQDALDHIRYDSEGYQYWDGTDNVYSASLAYDDVYVQENSVYLDQADQDSVKALVYTYGAVTVGIEFEPGYLNMAEINSETGEPYEFGRSFYNYSDDPAVNHSVTIVGWDDDYPKENFAHAVVGMDGEEAYELTTPSEDGAWIIQNSWSDELHDDGFVYVSYESAEFLPENMEVFAFDLMDPDTFAYNFQYDGTAMCYDTSDKQYDGTHFPYYTKAGTRAANVYVNTTGNAISIEAVGFTTYNLGETPYDISVYVGLEDECDPTSGTLAGTTRAYTTMPGCKTATLDEAVVVAPGETFSIVFSFPETNAFGVERDNINYYYTFDAETLPGQSFFSASATRGWVDMNDYEACFRIKAFANVAELPDEPEEPMVETGWISESGAWYYLDEDGTPLVSTWVKWNGGWYYLASDGKMVAGDWVKWNGGWYYLGLSGKMLANDWLKWGESWYYFDASGKMVASAWVKWNGSWYYFGAGGKMLVSSWLTWNDCWYYVGADGKMIANDWLKWNDSWYYFGDSGKMLADAWLKWNGSWYYFNEKGVCVYRYAA